MSTFSAAATSGLLPTSGLAAELSYSQATWKLLGKLAEILSGSPVWRNRKPHITSHLSRSV